MPKYKIVIPVLTRLEEHHLIEAENEDEAVEIALREDPEEWIDDNDYYEPQKGDIRVTGPGTECPLCRNGTLDESLCCAGECGNDLSVPNSEKLA